MKNIYFKRTGVRIYKTPILWLFLILLSIAFQNSFAATRTWTGAVSTSWADGGNWSPSGMPADADDIIIPSGCTYYPIILNNRKANSITVYAGGSITFQSGTVTINGGAVSNSGTILINGGTLDIQNTTGNLTNSGSLTISSGQLKVGNTFTNNSGYNFYVSGGTITAIITNYGTVTSSSGSSVLNGIITNQSGGIININGGSLEVKQEPSTNAGNISVSSGTLYFNGKDIDNLNGGSITQTGGTLELDHITNNGQITASGGTFTIDGFFTNYADKNINVNGGSIIVKNNTSINSGPISVSSGLLDFGTAGKDLTINSGGSVTQTGGTVTIKNLTVNSSSSYTFSGTALSITGNLTNSGTVTLNPGTVNVTGSITNNTSGNFTIAGAAVTSQSDATNYGTMNLSSGSFDLNTASKKLTINGGTFNQSGGTVSTRDMVLLNGGTYNQSNGEFQISHDMQAPAGTPVNSFNGTGGTVHFIGAAGGGADYTGTVQFHNVIIDNGADYNSDNNSDNIKISGNFTNNNPNLDNDKGTVTFNGSSTQSIYSASTPPGSKTTFGNLVVSNPNGVNLQTDLGIQTSINFNSGGYINANGYTVYLNGGVYNGPLPVELSSFTASVIGSKVKLNWQTATEVNNYGFDVERRTSPQSPPSKGGDDQVGGGWEKIGFVNGNGNSNSPKYYSFEDNSLSSGKYSYRLKQIDNDGQYEYSNTIEVDLGSPKTFELSQNYPNPFNPVTEIRYQLPNSSFVTLKVYDIIGNEVETLVNEQQESGSYKVAFTGNNLASGIYIYKLSAGSNVFTKKMILLK